MPGQDQDQTGPNLHARWSKVKADISTCQTAAVVDSTLDETDKLTADTLKFLKRVNSALAALPLVEAHWRLYWAPPAIIFMFVAGMTFVDIWHPTRLFATFTLGCIAWLGWLAYYEKNRPKEPVAAEGSTEDTMRKFCETVEQDVANFKNPEKRMASYRMPWQASCAVLVILFAYCLATGKGMAFIQCLVMYAASTAATGYAASHVAPRATVDNLSPLEEVIWKVTRAPHVEILLGTVIAKTIGLGGPYLVHQDYLGSTTASIQSTCEKLDQDRINTFSQANLARPALKAVVLGNSIIDGGLEGVIGGIGENVSSAIQNPDFQKTIGSAAESVMKQYTGPKDTNKDTEGTPKTRNVAGSIGSLAGSVYKAMTPAPAESACAEDVTSKKAEDLISAGLDLAGAIGGFKKPW